MSERIYAWLLKLYPARFREEYAKYSDCKKTISMTLATAGKSIFFSGLIVLISIASLILFPINVLYSIGIAGIVIVTVTVFCSLTFLPAMLCLLEKKITHTTRFQNILQKKDNQKQEDK